MMDPLMNIWPAAGRDIEMAKLIRLERDQLLLQEGANSTCMYWIQKGQLVVTKSSANGEVTLGHLSTGELVGEISFLDNQARSATVRALTDCELLEIPQETIEALFTTTPKWLEILVKTMAERLRKANSRIKI
jgi:CRP/FNR family transcriptional regulator, cyclic AMP receptor protein